MTALRQKMIEDMQLHGFAERTQDSYLRAVRQLAAYFNKPPDQISEEELRQYFLYLKNVKKASRSTITLALCGIKFFYERTLQRQWATLALVRPPQEKKLPVVLSVEEVRQILARVRRWHYRVCLSTIYACGLRLQEGLHLQISHIDGARQMVHVCHGQGWQRSLCAAAPTGAWRCCANIGEPIAIRSGFFRLRIRPSKVQWMPVGCSGRFTAALAG